MINLTGKSVFVKTQEEYLSVLKIAKFQGFTWARENHLDPIEIPFPNILNFNDSKIVTYSCAEKTLYEASEIVKDEEKIKDAVNLVRTFAKYPDRTALTDSLTQRENDKLIMVKQDNGEYIPAYRDEDNFKAIKKLADYEDLEEQGLLVRLPCKEAYSRSGDFVYLIYDYEIIECVHCGLGIDPLSGKAYITLATDEKLFPYRSPDPEQDLDPTDWCTNATDVEVSELGKTVFLTREEAEKKLEEMKNEI